MHFGLILFRTFSDAEMEFLHRLPELRIFVTFALLWLPSVLKVYSRNINVHDTFTNQQESYSAKVTHSHDASFNIDHFISKKLIELFSDQEKKDDSGGAIFIYNRNTILSGDDKQGELYETSMSKGRFGDFITGADFTRLKLQADNLHSKANVRKDDRKYLSPSNDVTKKVKDTNTNLVNERNANTAEHTSNHLKETGTNTTAASSTMKIKSKRGLSPDTCETEKIELELEFREHISAETSSYLLICKGRVAVNKCEGLCNSSVSPSVNHYDGFQRVSVLGENDCFSKIIEPRHDKTNKMSVRPAKTQISLGIRPV